MSSLRDRPLLIRVPLLPIAAAFALGVAIGYAVDIPSGLAATGALGCVVLAVAAHRVWRWTAMGYGLLVLAVLCTGVLRVSLAMRTLPADSLVRTAGDARQLVRVRGVVGSWATLWSEPTYGGETRTRMRFLIDGREVFTDTGWQSTSGRMQVDVVDSQHRPAVGSDVELLGWLSRVRPAPNPGMRDPLAYASRSGCWLRLWCENGELVATRPAPGTAVERWLRRVRSAAWTQDSWDGSEGNSLLAAMVLGRRDHTLQSLDDSMRRCGLGHYLSISGLHLGLFVAMVYGLCRLMLLSRRQAALVVLVVLAGYLLVAQPRPALVRSAIMAAVAAVALLTGRAGSTLNALSVAGLGMLCVAPSLVGQAGFQLSFVIVLGLIVLGPRVHEILFGRWLVIRSLVVYRGEGAPVRWFRRRMEKTIAWTLSGALVAWLVAFPLAAYHFGMVSVWGALLSVLVLPLVVLILSLGYLSLGLGWLAPNLGALLAEWAAGVGELLASWVRWFETWPGVGVELRPVSVAWVAAMYAAIGAILYLKKRAGRMALAAGLCCAAAWLTVSTQSVDCGEGVRLDVLSMGAGQCILVSGPGVEATWLDAGSRSYSRPWDTVAKGFLRSQRLAEPTQAVISHADSDHYNVLYQAANLGTLERVYVGGGFETVDPESAAGRFLFSLRQHEIPLPRPKVGDVISLGGGASFRILLAGVPASSEPNDQSLVGRLETPDGRVLLTADIEREGIAALLASGQDLRAEVLVLPHHGAWATQLPALLEAVGPRIVICSSHREPDGGAKATQAADLFYRSLRKQYEFYCTSSDGYLRVEFTSGRVTVTPWKTR